MFFDEDYGVAEATLDTFLQAWSEGNFEEAYDQLATNSPLKQGLTRDAWAIRRRSWVEDAKPEHMVFEIVQDSELEVEPMLPLPGDIATDANHELLEVFWSLEMQDTPLSSTLKELPQATAMYPEVKRHWFWTRFQLVEENGQWLIQDMQDEGAAALRLSPAELERRMAALTESVKAVTDGLGLTDLDPNSETQVNNFLTKISEDEFSLDDFLGQAEEIRWITLRGMHYSDAFIAQSPQDRDFYNTAIAQATSIDDWERAAAYLDMYIQRFPDERGEALRLLAISQSHMIEDESEERSQHFRNLLEQTLRAAIEADHSTASYTMLADLFIDEEVKLDEATQLLQEAQEHAHTPQDEAAVAFSKGKLAEVQDKPQEALKLYEKAAQLDPKLPEVWTYLGNVQSELGQKTLAITSYQRSIDEGTESPDAYVELAAIYIEQGKIEPARAILEDALRFFPEEAKLYAIFAMLEMRSGNLRHAEEYLAMGEEIDPNDEIVIDTRLIFDSIKAQQRASKPKGKNKSPQPKKRKK